MTFKQIPQNVYKAKLDVPTSDDFSKEQVSYLERIVKATEGAIEGVYREARRVLTPDNNPVRQVINVNGKSGSFRADVGISQIGGGVPLVVFADALGGAATITALDNAYLFTMVYVINGDAANTITIQNNSEILTGTGADVVLSQHEVISLIQVNNAPLWLQATANVTNS